MAYMIVVLISSYKFVYAKLNFNLLEKSQIFYTTKIWSHATCAYSLVDSILVMESEVHQVTAKESFNL